MNTTRTLARSFVLLPLLAACGSGTGDSNNPDDQPMIDGPAGGTPDAAADLSDAYIADAVQATCTPTGGGTPHLELVTTAGDAVLLVTAPVGDARQFIVERDGIVRIMRDGVLDDAPFLDITDSSGGPVLAGDERGLLGLAFHPDYAHNHRFFVYYTTQTKNIVAEYRATGIDQADASSGQVILAVDDFASNHNGGMIEFGPDGLLYIGTGDGGGFNDPERTGQDPDRLLGKILRIDIDNPSDGKPYGIPLSNPYASGGGAPEIVALGMRNPYRWSFDVVAGDMYIGDVGQDEFEELDIIDILDLPGTNFGWSQYEGDACFDPPCDPADKKFPVLTMNHGSDNACSIIGGAVYRGTCAPGLVGQYVYTDYCASDLRSLTWDGTEPSNMLATGGVFSPVSIHPDALGELWLTTVDGGIYRVTGVDP